MVEVTFFLQGEQLKGFEATGHAMAKAKGQRYDMVCAAISVLTLSTANGITEIVQVKPAKLEVDDGYLLILLPEELSDAQNLQAQALLQSCALGIEAIAKDFGKNVKVVKRRWTS